MHLADFIQEDGAGIGQIELAQLLPVGPGEGALLIAKQLAFQQLVRDGSAIHFDERFLAAARLRIDHARHHFLARTAFATDQHRGSGVRHLLDGVLHLFHPRTGSEESHEIAVAAYLVPELRDLGRESLLLQDFVDAEVEFLRLEGLAQVIVGAEFGGSEDHLRIVLRRQHYNSGIRLDLFDPFQCVQRTHAGGRQIQKDQHRIVDPEHADRLFPGGRVADVETAARQVGAQEPPHVGIIVNN